VASDGGGLLFGLLLLLVNWTMKGWINVALQIYALSLMVSDHHLIDTCTITIDPLRTIAPVDSRIYSGFVEHLGRCTSHKRVKRISLELPMI
jgi:hypothetical protein